MRFGVIGKASHAPAQSQSPTSGKLAGGDSRAQLLNAANLSSPVLASNIAWSAFSILFWHFQLFLETRGENQLLTLQEVERGDGPEDTGSCLLQPGPCPYTTTLIMPRACSNTPLSTSCPNSFRCIHHLLAPSKEGEIFGHRDVVWGR